MGQDQSNYNKKNAKKQKDFTNSYKYDLDDDDLPIAHPKTLYYDYSPNNLSILNKQHRSNSPYQKPSQKHVQQGQFYQSQNIGQINRSNSPQDKNLIYTQQNYGNNQNIQRNLQIAKNQQLFSKLQKQQQQKQNISNQQYPLQYQQQKQISQQNSPYMRRNQTSQTGLQNQGSLSPQQIQEQFRYNQYLLQNPQSQVNRQYLLQQQQLLISQQMNQQRQQQYQQYQQQQQQQYRGRSLSREIVQKWRSYSTPQIKEEIIKKSRQLQLKKKSKQEFEYMEAVHEVNESINFCSHIFGVKQVLEINNSGLNFNNIYANNKIIDQLKDIIQQEKPFNNDVEDKNQILQKALLKIPQNQEFQQDLDGDSLKLINLQLKQKAQKNLMMLYKINHTLNKSQGNLNYNQLISILEQLKSLNQSSISHILPLGGSNVIIDKFQQQNKQNQRQNQQSNLQSANFPQFSTNTQQNNLNNFNENLLDDLQLLKTNSQNSQQRNFKNNFNDNQDNQFLKLDDLVESKNAQELQLQQIDQQIQEQQKKIRDSQIHYQQQENNKTMDQQNINQNLVQSKYQEVQIVKSDNDKSEQMNLFQKTLQNNGISYDTSNIQNKKKQELQDDQQQEKEKELYQNQSPNFKNNNQQQNVNQKQKQEEYESENEKEDENNISQNLSQKFQKPQTVKQNKQSTKQKKPQKKQEQQEQQKENERENNLEENEEEVENENTSNEDENSENEASSVSKSSSYLDSNNKSFQQESSIYSEPNSYFKQHQQKMLKKLHQQKYKQQDDLLNESQSYRNYLQTNTHTPYSAYSPNLQNMSYQQFQQQYPQQYHQQFLSQSNLQQNPNFYPPQYQQQQQQIYNDQMMNSNQKQQHSFQQQPYYSQQLTPQQLQQNLQNKQNQSFQQQQNQLNANNNTNDQTTYYQNTNSSYILEVDKEKLVKRKNDIVAQRTIKIFKAHPNKNHPKNLDNIVKNQNSKINKQIQQKNERKLQKQNNLENRLRTFSQQDVSNNQHNLIPAKKLLGGQNIENFPGDQISQIMTDRYNRYQTNIEDEFQDEEYKSIENIKNILTDLERPKDIFVKDKNTLNNYKISQQHDCECNALPHIKFKIPQKFKQTQSHYSQQNIKKYLNPQHMDFSNNKKWVQNKTPEPQRYQAANQRNRMARTPVQKVNLQKRLINEKQSTKINLKKLENHLAFTAANLDFDQDNEEILQQQFENLDFQWQTYQNQENDITNNNSQNQSYVGQNNLNYSQQLQHSKSDNLINRPMINRISSRNITNQYQYILSTNLEQRQRDLKKKLSSFQYNMKNHMNNLNKSRNQQPSNRASYISNQNNKNIDQIKKLLPSQKVDQFYQNPQKILLSRYLIHGINPTSTKRVLNQQTSKYSKYLQWLKKMQDEHMYKETNNSVNYQGVQKIQKHLTENQEIQQIPENRLSALEDIQNQSQNQSQYTQQQQRNSNNSKINTLQNNLNQQNQDPFNKINVQNISGQYDQVNPDNFNNYNNNNQENQNNEENLIRNFNVQTFNKIGGTHQNSNNPFLQTQSHNLQNINQKQNYDQSPIAFHSQNDIQQQQNFSLGQKQHMTNQQYNNIENKNDENQNLAQSQNIQQQNQNDPKNTQNISLQVSQSLLNLDKHFSQNLNQNQVNIQTQTSKNLNQPENIQVQKNQNLATQTSLRERIGNKLDSNQKFVGQNQTQNQQPQIQTPQTIPNNNNKNNNYDNSNNKSQNIDFKLLQHTKSDNQIFYNNYQNQEQSKNFEKSETKIPKQDLQKLNQQITQQSQKFDEIQNKKQNNNNNNNKNQKQNEIQKELSQLNIKDSPLQFFDESGSKKKQQKSMKNFGEQNQKKTQLNQNEYSLSNYQINPKISKTKTLNQQLDLDDSNNAGNNSSNFNENYAQKVYQKKKKQLLQNNQKIGSSLQQQMNQKQKQFANFNGQNQNNLNNIINNIDEDSEDQYSDDMDGIQNENFLHQTRKISLEKLDDNQDFSDDSEIEEQKENLKLKQLNQLQQQQQQQQFFQQSYYQSYSTLKKQQNKLKQSQLQNENSDSHFKNNHNLNNQRNIMTFQKQKQNILQYDSDSD